MWDNLNTGWVSSSEHFLEPCCMQGHNKLEQFLILSLSWKEQFCDTEEHVHYGQNSSARVQHAVIPIFLQSVDMLL
jgi:ribonuclease I